MQLVPLQFRPGIIRDATAYTNKGGWFDGNLVRFRLGYPESMGGWKKVSTQQLLGSCRAMHVWFDLQQNRRLALGTHRKYYLEFGQGLYDITPVRLTDTLNGPFSATDGDTRLTVTHVAHGAIEGAFVTFSDADPLGGDITADILNQEFEIVEVLDDDSYQIELPTPATALDTGDGGAAVVAEYQVNPGLDTQVGGNGWGAPAWGVLGWGVGGPFNVDANLRIWTQDNFGEDLIYNVRDGRIFYWQNSLGLTVRGKELSSLPGADPETPVIATQVLVSDRDRHVIAFGANPLGSTDQDPMLVRFSDQENLIDWTPTATNTAGDIRLGSGSKIVKAIETKREILIWTDASMYSMRFIGPPFTFGVEQISKTATTMGFNCFAQAEDAVYWMGRGTFWMYSGQVMEMPCSVKEYVFGDINMNQSDKVYAGANSEFSEVIWFYPSADSDENNRYVIYNYKDQAWYYGDLERTAWIDCCPEPHPVAVSTDGFLYYHDLGLNDGSTEPPSPLPSYIESSPLDVQEGNRFMMIERVLPDLSFYQSTSTQGGNSPPKVTMSLIAQDFPGANFGNTALVPVERAATFPVEQFTNQVHVRLRTRSIRLRVESNQLNTRWQLGTPRVGMRPDGRR